MTFNKLHDDIQDKNCNCLEGAKEDTFNLYTRRIKDNTLSENDLLSFWELYKYNKKECNSICKLKGVSLNRFTVDTLESIEKKYRKSAQFNRELRANYVIFKLSKNAGLIKDTPTIDDSSHVDLYKSDGFSIKSIKVIKTVQLKK